VEACLSEAGTGVKGLPGGPQIRGKRGDLLAVSKKKKKRKNAVLEKKKDVIRHRDIGVGTSKKKQDVSVGGGVWVLRQGPKKQKKEKKKKKTTQWEKRKAARGSVGQNRDLQEKSPPNIRRVPSGNYVGKKVGPDGFFYDLASHSRRGVGVEGGRGRPVRLPD